MAFLLTQRTIPADLLALLEQHGDPETKLWQLGSCQVMVGRDWVDPERTDRRWHLSISHPTRYPTWQEIGEARDRLLPDDVWLCVPMPPREFWLSLHPNCFHLWEIHDGNLIGQWAFEGRAAKRMGFGQPQPEGMLNVEIGRAKRRPRP